MKIWRVSLMCLLATLLAACSSPRPGAYYQDDGPPERVPAGLDSIPDAIPRIEPMASGANQPYTINGKRYVPDLSGKPYRARGKASWYGTKFHGKKTSNGDTYDMYAMTAAHPTLPLPSYVRVTRVATGRSVVLRVNDRGPFHPGRIIDLSYAAAYKLGIHMLGSDEVIVERIMPDQILGATPHVAAAQPVTVVPVSPPVPVAAAVSAPTTTPAASGSIYLQVGAFRELRNAQALRSRLAATLSAGQPSVSVQQRSSLHHVRIGPYASAAQASLAAQRLSKQIGMTPILVKP